MDVVKESSIELDEMWSYVKNKPKLKWLWYSIDHNKYLHIRFGKKDYVFLRLKKLLKHFNVEINYVDNWGNYRKYIERNKHEIKKVNTQKIERKDLNLRKRIKRLMRKTIFYSKTKKIHDIVIGLCINIL